MCITHMLVFEIGFGPRVTRYLAGSVAALMGVFPLLIVDLALVRVYDKIESTDREPLHSSNNGVPGQDTDQIAEVEGARTVRHENVFGGEEVYRRKGCYDSTREFNTGGDAALTKVGVSAIGLEAKEVYVL